jgi:hypothetical protein
MVLKAAIATLALAACSSVELAPPLLRAHTGPAANRPMHRIVALPASCGTLSLEKIETADPQHPIYQSRAECPATTLQAIDLAIRSELELGGFSIIDSERVNAVTASRHEVIQNEDSTATTVGARFEDATPFEQTEILRDLGADAVLSTRVWVGAGIGMGQRREVAVQIRLLAAADGALAWARRCELEVGGLTTDEVGIDRGARCAIAGARAR